MKKAIGDAFPHVNLQAPSEEYKARLSKARLEAERRNEESRRRTLTTPAVGSIEYISNAVKETIWGTKPAHVPLHVAQKQLVAYWTCLPAVKEPAAPTDLSGPLARALFDQQMHKQARGYAEGIGGPPRPGVQTTADVLDKMWDRASGSKVWGPQKETDALVAIRQECETQAKSLVVLMERK